MNFKEIAAVSRGGFTQSCTLGYVGAAMQMAFEILPDHDEDYQSGELEKAG